MKHRSFLGFVDLREIVGALRSTVSYNTTMAACGRQVLIEDLTYSRKICLSSVGLTKQLNTKFVLNAARAIGG